MISRAHPLVIHLIDDSNAWLTVIVPAVATLIGATLGYFGVLVTEKRRSRSEALQRKQDRQIEFELGLLADISGILDDLSAVNSENASRLVGSDQDRAAKVGHMARVSSLNERLKIRAAHFAGTDLYQALDAVGNHSMELASSEDFDFALAANASLFRAFDAAAGRLAQYRRRLVGPDEVPAAAG